MSTGPFPGWRIPSANFRDEYHRKRTTSTHLVATSSAHDWKALDREKPDEEYQRPIVSLRHLDSLSQDISLHLQARALSYCYSLGEPCRSNCATISLAIKFRPDTSEICPGSDERHRYFTLFSRGLMAKSFSSFVDRFLPSITMNIVLCSPYPRATTRSGLTKLSPMYITASGFKNRKLSIDL